MFSTTGECPFVAYEPIITRKGSQVQFLPNKTNFNRSATESIEFLSDLSPQDKPWDYHKKLSETITNHYQRSENPNHHKYAERMGNCAPIVEFGWVIDPQTGQLALKLYHSAFCRVRHCPNCQGRRSMKWKARIYSALPEIEKQHPGHRWIFLTLTVKDPELENLKECLTTMRYAWRKMAGYKDYPAIGAIRGLEVTKDANGNPHPHFHALLLVPPGYFGGNYVKHARWVAMWRKALKADYDPMVNVQVIKPKKGAAGDDAAIRSAVAEALKYSVKPDELAGDPSWLYEMTDKLHGVRMVEVFGALRPFFQELEKEDEDLVHIEESGEVTGNQGGEVFYWLPPARRYGRKKGTQDKPKL